MVLDARLKKITAEVSSRKGAAAFVKSREPGARLSDLERSQAEEFGAMLEGMYLMAAVDGEVSDEELGQLRASIAAIVDMKALEEGAGSLDELLRRFRADLSRDGWKARLDDVSRRIPTDDGKAFAFRLAAGVAMVDDNVESAEAAAIDAFAAAMNLPAEESQSILREVLDELFH
ncbi:MAG TPA: hypothetical protein VHE30_14515 [Polyangiaceae bacterium]|nr:hypothetical protein [Polyangiaceae bacterium]